MDEDGLVDCRYDQRFLIFVNQTDPRLKQLHNFVSLQQNKMCVGKYLVEIVYEGRSFTFCFEIFQLNNSKYLTVSQRCYCQLIAFINDINCGNFYDLCI